MLVLTRTKGGKLVFVIEGLQNIVLTVLEISGGKVRLGTEAPPAVRVYRDEVLARIRRDGARNPTFAIPNG